MSTYLPQVSEETIDPMKIISGEDQKIFSAMRYTLSPFSDDEDQLQHKLDINAARIGKLEKKLFAEGAAGQQKSLLLVLQAMDTSGKGGVVKHVFKDVNAEGIRHYGFKKPTPEELEHDFLWRIKKQLPARGQIGIFDRSHYEDVLVHRVRDLSSPDVVEQRYGVIAEFEKELENIGTQVIKVMLNISPDEQQKRLMARLENHKKYWKYNPDDVDERDLWNDYMEAYQIAISRSATEQAPWYIIPADSKVASRLVISQLVVDALENMDLNWPPADYDIDEQKRRVLASNPLDYIQTN